MNRQINQPRSAHMKNHALKYLMLLTISGMLAPAHAEGDVRRLHGKPSKDQIIQALSAKNVAGDPAGTRDEPIRTRGLRPMPEPGAAPQPEETQRSAKRALDLEIMFEYDSARLTKEGREVLDVLGDALKSQELAGARLIVLEGHTDAKGSDPYNNALSMIRAQAARQYLIQKFSFQGERIRPVGKGKSQLADPADPDGAINRRVRVIVEG